MSSVLNRTTKQFLSSVNTPDYPSVDWIINPDLSAVVGFAAIYWTISGDTVSLMDAPTRAAVDAAILSGTRDATAALFDQIEDIHRAFAEVVLDELNLHATNAAAKDSAVAGAATLAALKTAWAAVTPVPQRTLAQLKTALRAKLGT